MKNKLLTLLAFAGLSLPAFAQTSDPVFYKNQLGIIASPSLQYLFQNTALPMGFIYKRQVTPNQAWRLSAIGSYEKQNDPEKQNGNAIAKHDFTNYNWNAMLGYEWQQELNKHFVFYYGADAGVNLNKFIVNSVNYISYQNDLGDEVIRHETLQSKDVRLTYQLKPMVGLKFRIHPKLYVATESTIFLTHTRINYKSSGTTTYITEEVPSQNFTEDYKRQFSRAWYKPLSNIQLVYNF